MSEVENNGKFNLLLENFEKLSNDNHLERTDAISFLEKNFLKNFEDNFIIKFELYFISLWDKYEKDRKGDWLSLNAMIIGLTFILKNIYVKKSFLKICGKILDNIANLIKHHDSRLRQNLPELFKIIFFEINEDCICFNLKLKLLLKDILTNIFHYDSNNINPKGILL